MQIVAGTKDSVNEQQITLKANLKDLFIEVEITVTQRDGYHFY